MKLLYILLSPCLSVYFIHAADDTSTQLTPCKKWRAYKSPVARIVVVDQHKKRLLTISADKYRIKWNHESKRIGADFHNPNRTHGTPCLALDNYGKIICLSQDNYDLKLLNEHKGSLISLAKIRNPVDPSTVALHSEGDKTWIFTGDHKGRIAGWFTSKDSKEVHFLGTTIVADQGTKITDLLVDMYDNTKLYIATEKGVHCRGIITNEFLPCGSVCSLAQDRYYLYTGLLNGNINIYDKQTRMQDAQILKGHATRIAALLCHNNRLYASSGCALSVWDTKTRKKLGHSSMGDGDSVYAPIALINTTDQTILYRGLKTGEIIEYDVSHLTSKQDKSEHEEVA